MTKPALAYSPDETLYEEGPPESPMSMETTSITFTIRGGPGITGIASNMAEDLANYLMATYAPGGEYLAGFDGPFVFHVATDASGATFGSAEPATCQHCGRTIYKVGDVWCDPEATGDDSVWSETCDSHDTFTAEHEPEGS